jgi:hypothetical protein
MQADSAGSMPGSFTASLLPRDRAQRSPISTATSATHDLRWLATIRRGLERRRSRTASLRRRARCPACVFRAEALERKAHFLVEALSEEQIRETYRRSDGLCFPHFACTLEEASAAGSTQTARLLLDDWRARLEGLRAGLAEFDRKRDYSHAAEPKGAEQRSWTEVVRRYVGEDLG